MLWDNVSKTCSIEMFFCDGYAFIGAINSVLWGGCFLQLSGIPKVL